MSDEDSRRLAELREVAESGGQHSWTSGTLLYVIGLLDASQARLASSQKDCVSARAERDNAEKIASAVEERASALAAALEWVVAESPKKPPDEEYKKLNYGS